MTVYHYVDRANDTDLRITLAYDEDFNTLEDCAPQFNSLSFIPRELGSYGKGKEMNSEDYRGISIKDIRNTLIEEGFYPVFYEAYIHGGVSVAPMREFTVDRQWDVSSPAGVVLIDKKEAMNYVFYEEQAAGMTEKDLDFRKLTPEQEKRLDEWGKDRIAEYDMELNGTVLWYGVDGVYKGQEIEDSYGGFGPFLTVEDAMQDVVPEIESSCFEGAMPEILKRPLLAEWTTTGKEHEVEAPQPEIDLDIANAVKRGVTGQQYERMLHLLKDAAEGLPVALNAKALIADINRDLHKAADKTADFER